MPVIDDGMPCYAGDITRYVVTRYADAVAAITRATMLLILIAARYAR